MQVGSFVRGVGAARTGGPEADSVGMAFVLAVVVGLGVGWDFGGVWRSHTGQSCSRHGSGREGSGSRSRTCRVGGRACSTEIEAVVTSAISE